MSSLRPGQVRLRRWHRALGFVAGARRRRAPAAWLALGAILVQFWLPLVLQALPYPTALPSAQTHHPAAASHRASEPRSQHGHSAPPAAEPADADAHHSGSGGKAVEVRCSLCIIAQTGQLLSPGAAPTLPPLIAARDPSARWLYEHPSTGCPLRLAQPRAPPSPAQIA